MKILYVASEVTPFSKTGGLGDVAGALPAELAALGHEVKVVTPRYASIQDARLTPTGHHLELRFPFGLERGPILSLRQARVSEANAFLSPQPNPQTPGTF